MSALERNNVQIKGSGDESMIFAHGFGCDQNMWRFVAPAFEDRFQIILFDHVGAGGSNLAAYDPGKYSTLGGYADDLVEIGRELDLKSATFVGHSVSAMIGVLASLKAPGMFKNLVLVGPSARYIDDGDYVGGFQEKQIDEVLDEVPAGPAADPASVCSSFMNWSGSSDNAAKSEPSMTLALALSSGSRLTPLL